MSLAHRPPACQCREVAALQVRAAVPTDADAVEDYHHRCFLTTYAAQLHAGEFGAPDRAGTRQQLHDWFLPGSGVATRVVVLEGVPIGHVSVSGHRLLHLFVDPVHHRTGLGRDLLAQGEAMIAALGHPDLELHARVENLSAISFYEHAGWRRTGRLIRTVEHGISYDEQVLVKHCS
ncbi:Acetyltransferase (GNAT) family protein [Blastococcus fimeti]|nr:Acetyltransferase (GNAT) family protein [Blastococcus fimeti]